MILEIIKEGNKYILKSPPKHLGDHFYIEVDSKHITRNKKMNTHKPKESTTYQQLKKLAARFPEDDFLRSTLAVTAIDYEHIQDKTDAEILYEALKEKYGL
jgi:hypothetical protein